MTVEIDYRELIKRFAELNREVPEIEFIIREQSTIEIKEVEGGGVVNWIIRVESQDGLNSVILKHGIGHARHNKGLKFSLGRQAIEYNSLKLMDRIIPGSVPKPYCYDKENHIICMEDLRDMDLLGNDLIEGDINLETASIIGKILAQMHKATSRKELTTSQWQELEALFADRENAERVHNMQYEDMFQEDGPVVGLAKMAVPIFRKNVSLLLSSHIDERLKEKMEVQECFIHGDCHWMSIFTKGDRIALFDFEWGHLGNSHYQLGWIAASYYISLMEAITRNPSKGREMKVLTELAFKTLVDAYHKWMEMTPAEASRKPTCHMDLSTFSLFCGNTLFFFAVLVGGEQLISLTDEQRCHLINIGSKMMLKSEDVTCLDDVTKLLFHSDEEVELKDEGDD